MGIGVFHSGGDLGTAARILEAHARAEARVDDGRRHASVNAEGGARLLASVVRDLDEARVGIDDIGLHRPTLDDVFLALTGRAVDETDADRTEDRREEVA